MTAKDLQTRIESLTQDVTFEFNGLDCIVISENNHKFTMAYNDEELICSSIDEVMKTPFFGGKPLTDIATRIKLT